MGDNVRLRIDTYGRDRRSSSGGTRCVKGLTRIVAVKRKEICKSKWLIYSLGARLTPELT
ncbi:hypothetical protein CCACVL1_03353 [Corchorus capsularis]|uniref:Uncharacterized protein n=1 Tax=Corchorus capsularis TaxID=210143 RepID=A0A1R3K0A9_COCAP|nr:hypothetical protein CCACVL1_03353 [Corchorus capsularis]